MGNTVGTHLVSSMLAAGLEDNLSLKMDVTWLKESEQEVFLYVWNHIRKYKKAPALNTVKGHFPDFDLNVIEEPPQFYADKCRERFLFEGLRTGMAKAKNLLDKKLEDFNPDAALQTLSQTVSELRFVDQSQDVVDFRKAHEPLYADYVKKVSGYYEAGVKLGWPTIDEISGGLVGGDVVSILGRPGMGKTWLLLHSAFKTWMDQKHSPMFVSMEMIPLLIEQRLAALHSKINPKHIKNAELTTVAKKKLFTGLKGLADYDLPFWIVNGNMGATVEDVYNLALQLQPSVVYIDGAYLMQAQNPRMSGWEKITETANGIKRQLATSLNIPVVNTYQFNRMAAEKMKKKPGEVGLEHIAGADAIGQNSSIVFGLLQEDNVESLTRKLATILKGRSGESGNFWVNWNFQGGLVGFDEIVEDEEESMLYLG